MAKKANFLKGAMVGALLGVAAALFLAPKTGKKLREDTKRMAADFYKYAAPRAKKIAKLGGEQYKVFLENSLKAYASAKKLSTKEVAALAKEVHKSWRHIKKYF